MSSSFRGCEPRADLERVRLPHVVALPEQLAVQPDLGRAWRARRSRAGPARPVAAGASNETRNQWSNASASAPQAASTIAAVPGTRAGAPPRACRVQLARCRAPRSAPAAAPPSRPSSACSSWPVTASTFAATTPIRLGGAHGARITLLGSARRPAAPCRRPTRAPSLRTRALRSLTLRVFATRASLRISILACAESCANAVAASASRPSLDEPAQVARGELEVGAELAHRREAVAVIGRQPARDDPLHVRRASAPRARVRGSASAAARSRCAPARAMRRAARPDRARAARSALAISAVRRQVVGRRSACRCGRSRRSRRLPSSKKPALWK